MTRTTEQLQLSVPLEYIETTIPAGLTVAEYRRGRPRRPSRRERLSQSFRARLGATRGGSFGCLG